MESRMTGNSKPDGWAEPTIAFLRQHLARAEEGEGWQHMSSSAYQIACETLIALGQADERVWGAVPRKDPRLPDSLSRWDDVCVAVLWLADQQGLIQWRLSDGTVPPARVGDFIVTPLNAPPPPAPNIAAIRGLGSAWAKPGLVKLLDEIGLTYDGRWTTAAETILWRTQPQAWRLNVTSDPRFAGAVQHAIDFMPRDIALEMNRIVTITDLDIEAETDRINAANVTSSTRHQSIATVALRSTPEQARKSLQFYSRHKLDWLFFCRWRLPDGWLKPQGAKLALKVFHDPLAIAMRKAVTVRRYPSLAALKD